MFAHRKFPHFALIIKINNQLYSLELVENDAIKPNDNNLYSNVNIFPLKDRIHYYSGDVFISSLNKPLKSSELTSFPPPV